MIGLPQNDPLLSPGKSLEQMERENEMFQQKLQTFQQMPKAAQRSSTPVWDEIDRIVSGLSDQELAVMNNDREYYDNSMTIQGMVNTEILALVRGRIESSAEGKAVLEQQLAFVRRMAKTAREETAKRDAMLREYMTEYSHLTWQEFIDMKNGKQPSAKPAKK